MADLPSVILTTESPDPRLGVNAASMAHRRLAFSSLGVVHPNATQLSARAPHGSALYKLSSAEPLPTKLLKQIFTQHVVETEVDWPSAYPKYTALLGAEEMPRFVLETSGLQARTRAEHQLYRALPVVRLWWAGFDSCVV